MLVFCSIALLLYIGKTYAKSTNRAHIPLHISILNQLKQKHIQSKKVCKCVKDCYILHVIFTNRHPYKRFIEIHRKNEFLQYDKKWIEKLWKINRKKHHYFVSTITE